LIYFQTFRVARGNAGFIKLDDELTMLKKGKGSENQAEASKLKGQIC
jgi:hypothetical protein